MLKGFRSTIKSRISDSEGFTILELLVVILIISTLIIIALPNFLGQTDKASDAQAETTLVSAGHSLAAINTEGNLPAENDLITQLNDDQPSYTFKAYGTEAFPNPSTGPNNISLVREGNSQASMCTRSLSGNVFCLRANNNGALILADSDENSLLDKVASLDPTGLLSPDQAVAAAKVKLASSKTYICVSDTGLEQEARDCLANSPDTPAPTCPEGQTGTPPDCVTPPTYAEAVAADGPGAQCNFDESGSSYVNLVCTNINGQYQDNSSKFLLRQDGAIVTDSSSKAAYFTGTTHYTYGNPSNASTNNQGANWSSEIWVKPATSGTDQVFISADDNWGMAFAGSNGFRCVTRTGNPWATVTIQGGPASVAGQWYHVVCTYNNGVFKLYVNGTEVATQSGVARGQSGNGNFRPGYGSSGWMSGSYLRGTLDNFTFYKSTLSPARVLAHYNAAGY